MVEAYISSLTPRSRIRVRFERNRSLITSFAVNFEIYHRRRWLPIVRYDTAHDNCKRWKYPHKHIFYQGTGSVIIQLKIKDYSAAFTDSYFEIKRNFRNIKANFFNQ
jgi:hypothetical protein